MGKKEKRKKRRGGGVAGIGVLALAALLAMDPFGLGIGDSLGQMVNGGKITGIPGDGEEETPSETPQATQTPEPTDAPEETATPAPTEAPEVVLKEVSVVVNGKQILYNAAAVASGQRLTAQLVADYTADLDNLIIKIHLKDAVYDTVEEVKLALESCGLTYEIVE